MAQPLCKRKHQLKQNPQRFATKANHPKFVCLRCGRVANKQKHLCEPLRIDKESD